MKARIEITIDESGQLETKSNMTDMDQVRHILDLAARTLKSPLVVSGFSGKLEKSDFRRPFQGTGKGSTWPQ